MVNLEQTILRNLLTNDSYTRKVLPYINPAYFEGPYQLIFKESAKYVAKYNRLPTFETLKIEVDQSDYNDEAYRQILEVLPTVFEETEVNEEWLIDTTEKWCQDRALFNAVMESISIIEGKHATLSKTALPDILSNALAVSFDANIGHDYLEGWLARYDYYNEDKVRIPFDLEFLNRITGGGTTLKTLNIILAGTGVGKSLAMCHMAAAGLLQGYNVLYITMEMAEERIAERIDANLMDIPIDRLQSMSKDMFSDRVARIAKSTVGKLIIKEYPTGAANASHFRALINELRLKKNFTPNIIFIDYLNICSSSRMKGLGGSINSYNYIKTIAEELRGLAVEFNVPIWSATQTNRTGYTSSDPGLEDTAESFGLPATADFMIAITTSEELEKLGQIAVRQLKNRYADPNIHRRFVLGVDRSKMKLFDVHDDEQTLVDDTPVYDKGEIAQREVEETLEKFKGFKL